MDFKKDEPEIEWTKDTPEKQGFDFDAFLGEENLDDRVTDALDGQDLLEPDAFGEFAPDYIPRRPGSGERGRHEAPGEEDPENEISIEENKEEETTKFDPSDPRYAAPERPHVVVAEPRKKVYVDPPMSDDFDEPKPRPRKKGRTGKLKGLLVALLLILIALAVLLIVLGKSSWNNREKPVDNTPAAQATNTPIPATPTPAQKVVMYSITVTAGTGGSVNPSGHVTVEEGKNTTFSIAPDSGYELAQLLIDGVLVDNAYSYTFSNVKDNHTIYAIFQSTATPTPPPTAEPTPPPTAEPTATPEPTPAPTEAPTATPEPTAEPTATPDVTEIPVDPAAESD